MPSKLAQPHPAPYRVVIVGGGVAGLEAMLALRALAEDRVMIDVIAPDREFVYGPLAVAEPFGLGKRARFDLSRLIREGGARHHRDAVVSVDVGARRVRTRGAIEFPYDALVVAAGSRSRDPFPGALTFNGEVGVAGIRHLLTEVQEGDVEQVVFAVASTVSWSLPLYELALMTANHLRNARNAARLTLITPEDRPLACFGVRASAVIANRLERGGIRLRTGVHPSGYDDRILSLVPDGSVLADRVVTLAVPTGTSIAGLPVDENGFIPVDEHCRVVGLQRVYAAGDVGSFPLKQGGIAAQQADVAARSIAAAAGALVTPVQFRPVLRGLLLTGAVPAFLRAPIAGGEGEGTAVTVEPLWWPPAKIFAKYLGPFLALRADGPSVHDYKPGEGLAIAREFDRERGEWRDLDEGTADFVATPPIGEIESEDSPTALTGLPFRGAGSARGREAHH